MNRFCYAAKPYNKGEYVYLIADSLKEEKGYWNNTCSCNFCGQYNIIVSHEVHSDLYDNRYEKGQ
jgi:hypothetical protein